MSYLNKAGLKKFIDTIIGHKSIKGIGDGTLTGAVAELNSNIIPDYSQQTLLLNGNGEHTVSRSGWVQVYRRAHDIP